MAVTIKDVAQLAGVSPSTVSRTCKDNPSISEETKERVRRAMIELGYEPNFQASNLASQNSRAIGIILPPSQKETFENAFFLEAIRGISSFCNEKQYINTVITGNTEEELLSVIKSMTRSGQVDGFIVLYSKADDPVINFLYSEGFLYVLIGKSNQNANQTIYVDNDNLLAGRDATEHLIQLGHKKIAYLGGDNSTIFSADRRAGYQLALTQHQIPIVPEYCIELPFKAKEQIEVMTNLLKLKDKPTAVVVCDDILALTLENICRELELSLPEDLSIVSFNNSLVARLTTPKLSSVDINSFQLGIEAASQMINHIENPNLVATKIIVPHYLVERESCVAINSVINAEAEPTRATKNSKKS